MTSPLGAHYRSLLGALYRSQLGALTNPPNTGLPVVAHSTNLRFLDWTWAANLTNTNTLEDYGDVTVSAVSYFLAEGAAKLLQQWLRGTEISIGVLPIRASDFSALESTDTYATHSWNFASGSFGTRGSALVVVTEPAANTIRVSIDWDDPGTSSVQWEDMEGAALVVGAGGGSHLLATGVFDSVPTITAGTFVTWTYGVLTLDLEIV